MTAWPSESVAEPLSVTVWRTAAGFGEIERICASTASTGLTVTATETGFDHVPDAHFARSDRLWVPTDSVEV